MSIDLEQQRKRAKDLRRAHARGDRDAAARIIAHLPRARGQHPDAILAARFTLSEAQLVVAREAGFESWPRLKHAIAPVAGGDESILDAAIAGRPIGGVLVHSIDLRVASGAAARPASAGLALPLAAALGDAPRVTQLLAEDPALANRRAGRRDWPPLLYACCARYGARDPAIVAARIAIAKQLLAHGADVDARGAEPGFTSENVDGFPASGAESDVEWWSALGGATGRVASAELIEVLVAAGADVEKAPQLLKHAVYSGDLGVLDAALAAKPPWWQVIWALVACADLDRPLQAKRLVPHAESPRSLEPGLLRCLREERPLSLFTILLGESGPADVRRAVEDELYRAARRFDNATVVALLAARGASDAMLTPADRAIAGLSSERVALRPRDHMMLSWAIEKRHLDRVSHLLAIGCDPDVHDQAGELPLHHAVRAGSFETIDALLAAGATIDTRNFDGRTALAIAPPEIAAHLRAAGAASVVDIEDAADVFERAADAVATGDVAALREMLDDEPELVHARSPRPHRCTLFHYTAANGTEAPRQVTPPNAADVAELLLARGSDPNASCKLYGGGSTALGLMLTSVHPRAAEVDGDLVRVYARHGATIPESAMATAVQYASVRAVAALVEVGLPITLWVAAALDRVDVIERLLDDGVPVDTRFADGYTALHAAAGAGHARSVELLLARGADRTLRDARWNGTPAGKAEHYGHAELAARLTHP